MATLLNALLASLFSAFLSTPEPVSLAAFTSYQSTTEVTVQAEKKEPEKFKIFFEPQSETFCHA
ncbi:hypothetical protein [Salinimicrobium sp. GXAS 041]|uniref:hypothetical protein n=1 Tax=Salinimicrobium sp. GXAS 041 TaxID=3400806 RepID=UPI003C73578D